MWRALRNSSGGRLEFRRTGIRRGSPEMGCPAVVQAPTGTREDGDRAGLAVAAAVRAGSGRAHRGGWSTRCRSAAWSSRSLARPGSGWRTSGWTDQVALHVVMGGAGETQWQWRMDMHRPAIVVGTVDSLVSKALNRGYGIGRATYPVDFALVTNGAHWVIDEVQLCPESTTTLRQLAAFARHFGTAEPFGLTCMSATVPESLLDTVDNPAPGPDEILAIDPAERTGELAARLDATRTVRRLGAEPGDYPAIARAVADLHRPGTLTLVVLNTVTAAREVHKALRGAATPCTLLHSRFRARERTELVRGSASRPGRPGTSSWRPRSSRPGST